MLAAADQSLLDALPSYLSISDLLKATPVVEGADRFIYIEASNEALDQQGEVVLAKALQSSADYYLKFGNLDLDHYTQVGARQGIPNYELYEIGRPVDVRSRDGKTFVKGQVYAGAGVAAERANNFWSSITELSPPQRWYPSVGGAVVHKSVSIDPKTGVKRGLIDKVRWTNIGFSKTPVNPDLATVSTVPFGALVKSWGAAGLDLSKALDSGGYVTDAAQATGGAALAQQSLDRTLYSYWQMRDVIAKALRGPYPVVQASAGAMTRFAVERFGLSKAEAGAFVERFLADLSTATRKNEP